MNKILLFSVPLAFFLFNLSVLQISILSVVWLAFGYFVDNVWTDYRFPTGPRGLPVIGSLHKIIYYGIDEYLHYLSKIYGGIFTVKLGMSPCIVISDYEMMKELSLNPNFQGRFQNGVVKMMFEGYGIIDSEGPRWKHQRRFMMHSLRDSGMGKMQMEEKITSQLENVTNEIAKSNGKSFVDLDVLLEKATCNVMFALAFNKAFEFDDPIFISRIQKLNETVQLIGKLQVTSLFKFFELFTRKDVKELSDKMDIFHGQSHEFIDEHKETLDEDNPRDLLDLFLIEMKKDCSPDDQEYHSTFTERQLSHVIIDLFMAGTETSSTTIRWAILYMLHHPEIQKKVQKEIDEVIGGNRAPTIADKLNLPYTVATLQEIERLGSVAPRGVPRSNQAPAKFQDYSFPKRCLFILHSYSIHRDPKLWDNPEEFNPGRFISKEGKVFRPPYLVPFGSGKRSCAGEALARMEIFLFFVTLLQKFTFLPTDGKVPEIVPLSGGVRGPKLYSLVAQPRN